MNGATYNRKTIKAVIFLGAFLLSTINAIKAYISFRKRKDLHLRFLLVGAIMWFVFVSSELLRYCFLLLHPEQLSSLPCRISKAVRNNILFRGGVQYIIHLLYSLAILFRLKLLASILPFGKRVIYALCGISVVIFGFPTIVILPYRMVSCPLENFLEVDQAFVCDQGIP